MDLLERVPVVHPRGKAGYVRFPLRLTSEGAKLATNEGGLRAGVARSYPLPLGQLPAVAPLLVAPGTAYPGAESLVRELVTLPTHSRLSERDRKAITAMSRGWSLAGAMLSR